MALVPVRVDRTSKPPLGTPLRSDGHWSVQGLVGAWAFNEGAGKSVVDSCGIAQLGSLGSTTKFAPGGIKYGSTGSNTDRVVIPANPMQSLLSFTIITAITLFASESNSGFCTRGDLTLGLYYNASGMGAFRYAGVALGYTPAINTRYILGVVQKGGAGTPWEAYIGGRKVAAGSYAVAPSGSVSEWIFGNTSLTGYSSSGCLQDFVLLHNHAKFTPQQISSLSANPWQIYEPETVWIEVGGAGGETRNLVAAITANSYSSFALSTMARGLISAITGQSVTPSLQAIILRNLLIAVSGLSATSTIVSTVSRSLLASISGPSWTPSTQANLFRNLLSSVAGESSTSPIRATVSRALLASVIGSSLTPGVAATISGIISLVASIPAQSLSSTAQATIDRALKAIISGQSGAPSISALIQGIISLVASVSGQSSTPYIAVTTARLLLAAINGESSTASSRASIARGLEAIVLGQSNTPGITAMLANMIALAAGISAQSTTPAALATLQRDMMAAIHTATSTGVISASTSRAMSAVIEGQSLTPDNVMATLAGLGLVLDTSIESRTVIRALQSLTKKYTINSI